MSAPSDRCDFIDDFPDSLSSSCPEVLENKYKFWRYNNPVGERQLEGLSRSQLDLWQESAPSLSHLLAAP